MQKPKRTIASLAVGAFFASSIAHAGAFSLYTEGSAAAIGNFAAGIAAEAFDASIGWYNPAGLVLLDNQQAVLSGVGVFPSTKLSGTSTFATEGLPSYIQSFTNLQGAKDAVVPAVHYALPLRDDIVFGLSIVSPYGLSTNYSVTSPVRYAATFTELLTANVAPELGVRLTENLSIGAGLDFEWAQVKFNRMLGIPTLAEVGGLSPFIFDSLSYNKGHSFGIGFHAGILAMFNENHTRLGFNYQSKINHTFHGYSQLTGTLAAADVTAPLASSAVFRTNNLFSNNIALPAVSTLSGYQDVTEKLALLGSIVYTQWNVFNLTQLNNVAAFSAETFETAIVSFGTVQGYRNTWRFAVGANYDVNEQWMLRVGTGYDQTPTVNAYRDVRLPDANRWALSIGTHYQMRPYLGFDFGYTYLFAPSAVPVNTTEALGTTVSYSINAQTKPHANLVGLQVVWTIDADVAPAADK